MGGLFKALVEGGAAERVAERCVGGIVSDEGEPSEANTLLPCTPHPRTPHPTVTHKLTDRSNNKATLYHGGAGVTAMRSPSPFLSRSLHHFPSFSARSHEASQKWVETRRAQQ